jgi:DNA-binding NtrC family response regulator
MTTGSVLSYGRTAIHNAEVGGVRFSAHLVWLAANVSYDRTPPVEVRREWAERLGLLLIVQKGHDHLQPLTWKAG